MIIRAPPGITFAKPPAHVAVFHRLRIRFVARPFAHRLPQPLPHISVIRRILGHAILFARKPLARWHHPKKLRHRPLNFPKQVRIQRELQNRRRLRFPSQLRVGHLVRPRPAFARRFDASQQVWPPKPLPVAKGSLRNHLCAPLHQCHGFRQQSVFFFVRNMAQVLDRQPLRRKMSEIRLFMPLAKFQIDGKIWRSPFRLGSFSPRHLQIQRGKMPARKVISQVRRRQSNLFCDYFHLTESLRPFPGGHYPL